MRAVVVLVLVAASTLFVAAPAFACSCAERDPGTALEEGDAVAIVSTEEAIGRGGPPVVSHKVEVTVERVLHGDLEEGPLEITTTGPGASCGFELFRGQTTGVVLDGNRGRWSAGLCDQISPGPLLAAAGELPTEQGGHAALVAAGEFGSAGLVLLDGEGRPLGWGEEAGYVAALSACPGGRYVTEVVSVDDEAAEVVVRRLPDLDVIRSVTLPGVGWVGFGTSVACSDSAAGRIVVGTHEHTDEGIGRGSVHVVRDGGAELVIDSDARRASTEARGGIDALAVTSDTAYLVFVSGEPEWSDRRATLVMERLDGSDSSTLDLGQVAVESAVPSPDGKRLALTAYSHEDGVGQLVLTVDVDPSLRIVARAESPAGGPVRRLLWLDDEHLVVRTPETAESDYLADLRLRRLRDLPATAGWEAAAVGETLYTAGGATMRAVALDSGEVEEVGPLHLASASRLVPLAVADVPSGLQAMGPLPAPAPLPTPTLVDGVPRWLMVSAGLLAIVLTGAAVWLVRRGTRWWRARRTA